MAIGMQIANPHPKIQLQESTTDNVLQYIFWLAKRQMLYVEMALSKGSGYGWKYEQIQLILPHS